MTSSSTDLALNYNFSGRDYTARFEAIITRLRAEVQELTDLNHSDAGISIIRLLARESDMLSAYMDEAFNEGYIELALFLQSLVDLAKTVDVLPKLPSSAKTVLTLSRETGETGDKVVAQYAAFTRTDGISYLANEAATLLGSQESIDIEVTQGILVSLALNPQDFTINPITKRGQYNLGPNVAAGTLIAVHGDPEHRWTEIDGFWRSLPTDYHYQLELYAEPVNGVQNTIILTLGDGVQGRQLPPETLRVKFIRTDGAAGNTGYGTIVNTPSGSDLVCTNPEPATGGAPAELKANFRRRIPAVVRTQRRGVTVEDYETLIESIPGVLHCQAVDRNFGHEWPHMYIFLFAVPEGGGPLSQQLKDTIYDQMAKWGHFGAWKQRYQLRDAVEIPVNISCTIGVLDGYSQSSVISKVTEAIKALLLVNNQTINGSLMFSSLHSAALSCNGVSWIEFDTRDNIQAGIGEILVEGTITVTASQA